jgi:hypothetical protein
METELDRTQFMTVLQSCPSAHETQGSAAVP